MLLTVEYLIERESRVSENLPHSYYAVTLNVTRSVLGPATGAGLDRQRGITARGLH